VRALAALLLLAAPAAAQQVDCANAQVQVEINFCAEQGWLRADAELNRVWGRAKDMAQSLDAGLPRQQQGIWQALLDGQRAWITYRDKTCEAAGGFMRGGSAESMLIYGCREQMTWTRVDELETFANGY
jgi:uncharacterized protein YecT (DUF1311 family)